MACGTVPKVNIRPSMCEPDSNIYNIEYTGDDIDYTLSADANSVDTEAFISDIVCDEGEGFYQIAPHKEGDQLPTFTNNFERDANGVKTNNQEVKLFVKSDTPEVRAFGKRMFGKVIDLRITYEGDYEYKYEVLQSIRMSARAFDSTKRGWLFTFTKTNPDVEAMLVFKTDVATTKALIASTAL